MNVNDLFPSRFVKAHDLGGKAVTVTIRDVTLEEVGHGAEQERKLALAFEKATKMMLLNRTNAMIIASMYGPETDAWLGKTVTIYSARVKAFGAWHDALRVKEQIPARNVGAAKIPDAMLEEPPLDDEDDLLDVDEGQEPAQNATQTPATPSNGENAQNGTARKIDASTGEIMDTNGDVLFDTTPDYAREWQALTGKEYDLVKWVSTLHRKSTEPCTLPQYQFLTGIMDKLTSKNHRYALSLLCQSVITKDNLPGRKVADNLLDLLTETIKEEGEEDKPNPNYRDDMADLITAIATVSTQQQELLAT